jgi:hypothetical protein
MIARFSGRSKHTYRIKNKPNPQGYKILSLCDFGYTYSFIFVSRICNNPDIETIPGLNNTSCEVWHLIKQLPLSKSFNIFMDNYFSNINLFNFLRNKKIGACGTTRTNSTKFPKILKIKKKLDWDILSGVVVDDVLALLWIDNGPVTMLTTIHEINEPQHRIQRLRRRPRITSANATKVRNIFGDEVRKELPIPIVVDDYNHFMGSVDIADQLRSNYIIQFPVRRTWLPLFFWLLDTAIINSYLIFNLKNNNNKVNHKEFRLNIAWKLIKIGLELEEKRETRNQSKQKSTQLVLASSSKLKYVTSNYQLPLQRLIPGNHLPEWRKSRLACVWCKFQEKENNEKSSNPPQSQIWCSFCNVPLCCNNNRSNCFKNFHNSENN